MLVPEPEEEENEEAEVAATCSAEDVASAQFC